MNEYNKREYRAQMFSRSLCEAFPVSEGYHNAIEYHQAPDSKGLKWVVGIFVLMLIVGSVANLFI